MQQSPETGTSRHVYRIDRFVVPAAARAEFLSRIRQTHDLLHAQPGFVRDLVVEQPAGPRGVTVLTLAEWDGEHRIEGARAAVQAMHRAAQFDPRELFARLGIEAEMGLYRPVDA